MCIFGMFLFASLLPFKMSVACTFCNNNRPLNIHIARLRIERRYESHPVHAWKWNHLSVLWHFLLQSHSLLCVKVWPFLFKRSVLGSVERAIWGSKGTNGEFGFQGPKTAEKFVKQGETHHKTTTGLITAIGLMLGKHGTKTGKQTPQGQMVPFSSGQTEEKLLFSCFWDSFSLL